VSSSSGAGGSGLVQQIQIVNENNTIADLSAKLDEIIATIK
jgi:hypothetical protein